MATRSIDNLVDDGNDLVWKKGERSERDDSDMKENDGSKVYTQGLYINLELYTRMRSKRLFCRHA